MLIRLVVLAFFMGLIAVDSVWAEPPCGSMTKDKAATILDVPAQELEYKYSEQLRTCSFSKGWRHSISYVLYDEKSADNAIKEMEKVASGLQMLVECKQIEGAGEQAISCHGDRAKRLLVRQGATWVDVLTPGDLNQKLEVAKGVLE